MLSFGIAALTIAATALILTRQQAQLTHLVFVARALAHGADAVEVRWQDRRSKIGQIARALAAVRDGREDGRAITEARFRAASPA